jgi:hypothetical protein
MSNLFLYSIYDKKVKAFNTPFTALSDDQARSMFKVNVDEKGSMFNRFPEDYALWKVGKFDTGTANIQQTNLDSIIQIDTAMQLKEDPTGSQVEASDVMQVLSAMNEKFDSRLELLCSEVNKIKNNQANGVQKQ